MFGTILGSALLIPIWPTNMSLNRLFDVDSFNTFIGKLGHQVIFNDFLEDGQMVRRHSNEGEVIEKVIIILFLDVCRCNFFSRCILGFMMVTLLIITYVN